MTILTTWTRYRVSNASRIAAGALAVCVFLMLAACANSEAPLAEPPIAESTAEQVGSCSLGHDVNADAEEAIRAVLEAEGESVVRQDIDMLMKLWAEDGLVSDAKNTPEDDSDDQTWDGRDAIRHRYVRTVFPGAPDSAQPADLQIQLDGDTASVTATTQIGTEVSPAGDRWQLTRENGCWIIQSLTYNLEPVP